MIRRICCTAVATLLVAATQILYAQPLRLLVGTYTEGTAAEGVYLYAFDSQTAGTCLLSVAPAGNPSFVIAAPDGKMAYSVNEYGDGRQGLSAYLIESETLTPFQQVSLLQAEEDPCNVLLTGGALISSNYTGGSITAFCLDSCGRIAAPSLRYRGGKGAHMHCAVPSPDEKYIFVTDLGSDCIHRFDRAANGSPSGPGEIVWRHRGKVKFGPRHMVFSADGQYAYLLCELGDKLVVFHYADGALKPVQTLTAYDGRGHGSADIHLSPDGQFLLCACRDDNCIEIFRIDPASGALMHTGRNVEVGAPVCVQFVP